MSDTQRFTGAYTTSGIPGYSGVDTEKNWPRPNRQDTTFISQSTGAARTFLPGDLIDNTYQLLNLLGRGGMGVVFSCRHITLGQEYALKLLSDGLLSEESWSRFQAEAKALARLNHSSIVGIHNMGIEGGQYPYYVMDLLSGETLDVLVDRNGPLPVDQALDLFIQVSDALSSAHLQGIIHRDIKPPNLMLVRDRQNRVSAVKIVDFGIARLSKHSPTTQSQTAAGLVFGTPYYMSPEQCQGLRADERSDIYSLGCALFETLTGRPPFRGDNAFHTFLLHQSEAPPSLASVRPEAEFPQSLELAVEKMLAKKASNRYQTMLQVQHDLERIKAGKPVLAQGLSVSPLRSGKDLAASDKRTRLVDKAKGKPLTVDPKDEKNEKYLEEEKEDEAQNQSVLPRSVVIGVAMFLIFFLAGACLWIASLSPRRIVRPPVKEIDYSLFHGSHSQSALAPDQSMVPKDDWLKVGYTEQEIQASKQFDFEQLSTDVIKLGNTLPSRVADKIRRRSHFKKDKGGPIFRFFEEMSIGAIQIGGNKPVLATGSVPFPNGSDAYLYLETATTCAPDLLCLFGPDDLTGLDVAWPHPQEAISRIANWHRLKEFSFFNPLLKMPPGRQSKDESPVQDESPITDVDLVSLNQFTGLRSLGLCGRSLTTEAILSIPMLPKLEALRLKSIQDIRQVLRGLCPLRNLTELWLINEGTDNSQLEILTGMKNLSTLKIRRCFLAPDSVQYFGKMSALKDLSLDCNWNQQQKDKFTASLPHCHVEFEPTSDLTFWHAAAPPTSGWKDHEH